MACTGFYCGGVSARPKGPKAGLKFNPLPTTYGSEKCCKFPQRGTRWSPGHPMLSYILSALDGVSCCILGAICSKKLYAVHCGKGSCQVFGSHAE